MVEARASQGGLYALLGNVPEVRASQAGIYALVSTGVPTRISQAGLYSLTAVTPQVRLSQMGVYLLANASPCITRWCQIWTIRRLDGEVFRFTSLDRDLDWLGETYQACGSLTPSASEAVSEVDAAGNMDLSGALGDGGITVHDLHAGLFDGASVEAWLVAWAGEAPRKLLLRGTFGAVELGKTGFKVELVGDGARLMQTPLVSKLQPGCRWLSKTYGGFGGPFCRKNLVPLTVVGTVDSSGGQRIFTDAGRAEASGYFSRGKVTFTSGDNAGVSREIKEHGAGGVFSLWEGLPFALAPGDAYSMTPGCTGLKEASGGTNGCTAWDNELRFGGFDKVPGGDRRGAAANVRPPG